MIYIIEQWYVVYLVEEIRDHNNFLFFCRKGECMYKKNQVSVNSTGHNLDVKVLQHLLVFSYGKDCRAHEPL